MGGIVLSNKKKRGVAKHDVRPPPLKVARLFIVPSQLTYQKKKYRGRNVVLQRFEPATLGDQLRARHGRGKTAKVFLCVCELASNPKKKQKQNQRKQKQNQTNFFKFHRQTLSYWDRLPSELQQTIQWMADRQQAHDRLKRGWDKIHCQGFKDVCQFCQVRMQPRDNPARVWDYSPQKHGEECNFCFDCLIYYDNSSAWANNRCTQHISATV